MVVRIICFVKWSYQVNPRAAADEVNDEDEQRRGSPNYLLFLFSTEGCPILSEDEECKTETAKRLLHHH